MNMEDLIQDNQRIVDEYNAIVGNLDKQDGINCDKCHNKGRIKVINPSNPSDDPISIECECMARRKAVSNFKNSNLGDYGKLKMADFKTGKVFLKHNKEIAFDFINDPKEKWFTVLGKTGTGKTLLTAIVANELLRKGYEVFKVSWMEVKETYENRKGNPEEWNNLKTVEVLLLDDILKNWNTETAKTVLYDLLDFRYKHKAITIISGEPLMNELMILDRAVAGRINEMSNGFLIQNTDENSTDLRWM